LEDQQGRKQRALLLFGRPTREEIPQKEIKEAVKLIFSFLLLVILMKIIA
jgi:hypothetical protein